MLPLEHSAILLTCIKRCFWPSLSYNRSWKPLFGLFESGFFYTGFTVWATTREQPRCGCALRDNSKAQSDQSSISARRKILSFLTHGAHCEDSDQTGLIPRLIWVFFLCRHILLDLSCHCSLCYMIYVWQLWLKQSGLSLLIFCIWSKGCKSHKH